MFGQYLHPKAEWTSFSKLKECFSFDLIFRNSQLFSTTKVQRLGDGVFFIHLCAKIYGFILTLS